MYVLENMGVADYEPWEFSTTLPEKEAKEKFEEWYNASLEDADFVDDEEEDKNGNITSYREVNTTTGTNMKNSIYELQEEETYAILIHKWIDGDLSMNPNVYTFSGTREKAEYYAEQLLSALKKANNKNYIEWGDYAIVEVEADLGEEDEL